MTVIVGGIIYMIRRSKFLAISIAAIGFLGFAPASATTLVAHMSGTVDWMYGIGAFAGVSTGDVYDAAYTYDSATLAVSNLSLRVGAMSADLAAAGDSAAKTLTGSTQFYQHNDNGQYYSSGGTWVYSTASFSFEGTPSLDRPHALMPVVGYGQVQFLQFNWPTATYLLRAYAGLKVDTFSISDPSANSAVPEPDSWVLMVAGFACVGLVARTRQRSGRRATQRV